MVDFRDDFSQYAVSKLPTFRDDFSIYADQASADLAWVPEDVARSRVNTATDVLDLDIFRDNTNDAIVHDLGSTISDSNWVLRFKLQIDTLSLTALQTHGFFGLFDGDGVDGEETQQNSIGVALTALTGTLTYRLFTSENDFISQGVSTIFTHALAVETVYVEIKRNSKTTYEVNLYSDAKFTTLIESQQGICTVGTIDLRYIGMKNNMSMNAGSRILGSMDDVEFWDSEKQIIFQDDFATSANWVQTGTGVSITGGVISGWGADAVDRRLTHDLGTPLSDSKWIAEFEYMFTASNVPAHAPLLISDINQDVDAGTNDNDFITMVHGTTVNELKIVAEDFGDLGSASFGSTGIPIVTSTPYFPRLERVSPTLVRLSVFSDSARTTHIASSPVTLTIPSTIDALQYVHSQNLSGGGAGRTLTGTLDNLVISEPRSGNIEGAVTIQDDFTVDNFVETGTLNQVNTGTGVLDFDFDRDTTNHKTVRDLVSTSDDNWTLRWKQINATVTPTGTPSALGYIGMMSTDNTVSASTATDFIGLEFIIDDVNNLVRFKDVNNQSLATGSGVYSFVGIIAVDTRYWEIKRLSATTAIASVYSDALFTELIETSGVQAISINVTGLQFIGVATNDQATSVSAHNGTLDNIEFYDGVSVAKTPVKTKIVDLEDTFWEDNWDDAHASSGVNTSTQVIDYTFSTINQNEAMVFDLEKVLGVGNVANPNKWTLRFKFNITSTTPSTANLFFVGLNNTAETSGAQVAQHGVNIAILDATGGVQGYRTYDWDNQIPNSTGHDEQELSNPFVLSTDYYAELKRTSLTTYECQVFTDPDYTNPFGAIITGILTTTAGLRYIKILNADTATAINLVGTIDKVQFWNGTESVEHKAKWVEVNLP